MFSVLIQLRCCNSHGTVFYLRRPNCVSCAQICVGLYAASASVTPTVWLEGWSSEATSLCSAVGIGIKGGKMLTVLERGAALPATNSCSVTTSEDYQTKCLIEVFYGDYGQTEKNTLVDSSVLIGIPARKQGEVDLKLKLTVDVEGLVTLEAEEVIHNLMWEESVFSQRIRK